MYNEIFFCISRKINVLFSGYLDLCVFVRLFSLWRHQLQDAADFWCVLQLMMTFLYVETYVWTSACVAKRTSGASCSWWWFFYMSKRTCGQVLVLQSRRLVRPAAEDDFFICRNVHVDKCLCCKADVWCVLQLMMTLLNYFTLCKIVSFEEK